MKVEFKIGGEKMNYLINTAGKTSWPSGEKKKLSLNSNS